MIDGFCLPSCCRAIDNPHNDNKAFPELDLPSIKENLVIAIAALSNKRNYESLSVHRQCRLSGLEPRCIDMRSFGRP
jgi:hypothetical protein